MYTLDAWYCLGLYLESATKKSGIHFSFFRDNLRRCANSDCMKVDVQKKWNTSPTAELLLANPHFRQGRKFCNPCAQLFRPKKTTTKSKNPTFSTPRLVIILFRFLYSLLSITQMITGHAFLHRVRSSPSHHHLSC